MNDLLETNPKPKDGLAYTLDECIGHRADCKCDGCNVYFISNNKFRKYKMSEIGRSNYNINYNVETSEGAIPLEKNITLPELGHTEGVRYIEGNITAKKIEQEDIKLKKACPTCGNNFTELSIPFSRDTTTICLKCVEDITNRYKKEDKLAQTPEYYKQDEKDLYDRFIAQYGLETWLRHVEMECIQYLTRCTRKGSYLQDIKKVKIICERILVEVEKSSESY